MESDYSQQNEQLKQLHLERMKRKAEQSEPQELTKTLQKQQEKEDTSPCAEIYLNSIIYDKRKAEAKYNNITLAQLLHEEVKCFPLKPISKNVESLLITTYGYQPQVFEPIIRSKVPFIIVNREGQEKDGFVRRKFEGFGNLTLVSPPKSNFGYGVFHTKLWLVKFSTFLRVVISTSNNHLFDWAVWQNAFWYQDFPLIVPTIGGKQQPNKEKQRPQNEIFIKDFDLGKDFKETLKWVLTQMQPKAIDILSEMKIDLEKYSFEDVSVVLIPSLPGRFKGQFLDRVGIAKVKKIMGKCTHHFIKPVVTYNCTSLGKLDQKFIREFYFAFNPKTFQFYPEKFRLVFPTDRYIRQETCGQAQVLFLTKQNYDKSQMRGHIFHKYEASPFNGVEGGIPHLKTVIIEDEQEGDRCMLYLGSHNFTRAAWGTYQKDGSQISCSNSELGLLFVNYSKKSLLRWLPNRYPPAKYLNTDRPFFKQMQ